LYATLLRKVNAWSQIVNCVLPGVRRSVVTKFVGARSFGLLRFIGLAEFRFKPSEYPPGLGLQGESDMKRIHRLTAWGLTAVLGLGMLATPFTARASEEGERNTALGLTAAAAALLLTQRNKLPGIIAGAGAAYAWKKNQDSINSRHDRERRYGNDRRDWDRDDHWDRNRDRDRDRWDRDRDRDDYRFGRRDPVSGRYTNNNRRDNDRYDKYDKNDRYRNDGPPFGRALGHNKNKR
jgi:hypothetical protein